jgi:hypothetical protein
MNTGDSRTPDLEAGRRIGPQSWRLPESAPTGSPGRVSALTMNRPLICMLLALAALAGGLVLNPPAEGVTAAPKTAAPRPTRSPLSMTSGAPIEAAPAVAVQSVGGLPDPDRVGPCPEAYASLAVARRGLDEEGRPTWWHVDGTITKRIVQRVREDGREVEVPSLLRMTPRSKVGRQPDGSATSR